MWLINSIRTEEMQTGNFLYASRRKSPTLSKGCLTSKSLFLQVCAECFVQKVASFLKLQMHSKNLLGTFFLRKQAFSQQLKNPILWATWTLNFRMIPASKELQYHRIFSQGIKLCFSEKQWQLMLWSLDPSWACWLCIYRMRSSHGISCAEPSCPMSMLWC